MQLEIEVMGDGNAFIRSPLFGHGEDHTGTYWVGTASLDLGDDYRLEPVDLPGSKGAIRLCRRAKPKHETLCIFSLSWPKTYDVEITPQEDGSTLVAMMIPRSSAIPSGEPVDEPAAAAA